MCDACVRQTVHAAPSFLLAAKKALTVPHSVPGCLAAVQSYYKNDIRRNGGTLLLEDF